MGAAETCIRRQAQLFGQLGRSFAERAEIGENRVCEISLSQICDNGEIAETRAGFLRDVLGQNDVKPDISN